MLGIVQENDDHPTGAGFADDRDYNTCAEVQSSLDGALQKLAKICAVDGWLTLGAPEAAWETLAPLWPAYGLHPAALHQKARVLVALGRTQEARQTIASIARIAPHFRLALLDDPALDAVWIS